MAMPGAAEDETTHRELSSEFALVPKLRQQGVVGMADAHQAAFPAPPLDGQSVGDGYAGSFAVSFLRVAHGSRRDKIADGSAGAVL